METKPGPFKLLQTYNQDCENQIDPNRNYDCDNYPTCLNLAAALDWDNFHCSECCGKINQALMWQAKQAEARDKLVGRICHIDSDELLPTVINLK